MRRLPSFCSKNNRVIFSVCAVISGVASSEGERCQKMYLALGTLGVNPRAGLANPGAGNVVGPGFVAGPDVLGGLVGVVGFELGTTG